MEIILVDQNDQEIGTKNINEVDWIHDIYRSSAILLYNKNAEILIAQRSFTKKQSPGRWDASAAGIVEAGETYQSNILKETREELGLDLAGAELVMGPKTFAEHNDPKRQHFTQWFYAYCDRPIDAFALQKNEVEGIRWMARNKLLKEMANTSEQFADLEPAIITACPEAP